MPTNAMHSFDTILCVAPYDTGNPAGAAVPFGAWGQLAEVYSLSGPQNQSTVTNVTHLTSAGKAKEKVPGFLDGGQVTVRVNFSEQNLADFYDRLPGATDGPPSWGRYDWCIQYPDGSQWYFQGFVQGLPVEVPEDDRITHEVTIEVSGRPIFNNSLT